MSIEYYPLTISSIDRSRDTRQAIHAVLDRNGIYYITRLDGTIITTWHHVNHPAMQRAANHDEPDFSKVS
ncbi:MAG: DUF4224 domain-containing protein [Hahellaceae bacterium]|nr:DUF4224 domain-containing protein [Hahellaceae bacterium]